MKTSPRSIGVRWCWLVILVMNLNQPIVAQEVPADQLPQTVAETSDYKSTSRSTEVIEFIDQCVTTASHVSTIQFGETVEGRPMVAAIVAAEYYELGDQDQRNVILLLGNIHSGECAGKEALLMLLRELTHDINHPWLEKNVFVIVPNYNADANERIGKLNRPGQIGPENGMGRRENAQELDLNRDFMKLESPEARALVKLIDTVNPHLFVDCHTTNGSQHRYALTYDIPHNPSTAEPIRDFLRQKMMPAVTKQLAEQGTNTFYYGNFNADHSQWFSFGHEPRYSTEYVGLRGRLAILSEAYSYITYRERIEATKDFLTAVLDYANKHQSDIHNLLERVDGYLEQIASAQPQRIKIATASKPTAFPEKFTLLGYKNDEPHDYQCDFVSNYIATETTPLPYAYVIPQEFSRVIERMKMHGIEVKRLTDTRQFDLEIDTITDLKRQSEPFQKHHLVRAETNRKILSRRLQYGDYLVQTDQPLGRLAAYLLESESDDGFVCWNFFDSVLKPKTEYPVWRLPEVFEIQTEELEEIEKFGVIDLNLVENPNSLLGGNSDVPNWFGKTNLIKTQINNREMLIDGATAAFVDQPAAQFDFEKMIRALADAGIDNAAARKLLESNPLVALDGKHCVLNHAGQTFVYSLSDKSGDKDVQLLLRINANQILGEKADDDSEIATTDNGAAELFAFNHDETKLSFVTSAGLQILDLKSNQQVLIAAVNEQNLVGKLDWVYQEELYGRGNFAASWWNPTGNQLAFLSLDESPLIPFGVMDHLPVRGKLEQTNYPKAGDPLPKVKVGVADLGATGEAKGIEPTWVELNQYDDQEILISRVSWSADGKVLLLQIQDRQQTWLDLVATDPDGSNPRVLFRDSTPAWIESPGDPMFVADDRFLWLSPRDGYNRIYEYRLDGSLLKTLTTDDWEVRSLIGVDPEKTFAYFMASENAIDLHPYRLNLDSGTITRLTSERGTHDVTFSHDYSLFLDYWSTVNQPPTTRVFRNDGKRLLQLNVSSDDRLEYLKVREPEFVTIPAGDGLTLDALAFKPSEFSPLQKYPVLVHVYGGPQTPRVRNRFDSRNYFWFQMLAQQGYIVFVIDNRSASYRNAKNVWPIHKQLAKHELDDIETGVAWLRKQNWVDGDRIGIWGWSYGGYMTLYALTHSKSFKMGIAGAPVTDWKNYDAIYTERYMGLPQENPEGYAESSVLKSAKNLSGKLLLIHGSIDDNVHLNNSMQFVKALQDAGKHFELMIYPDNRHSVTNPKQAAHLRKLMTDFILENL